MWIIRIKRALRDSFAAWEDFDEKCSRLRGKGKDVEYGISNRFGMEYGASLLAFPSAYFLSLVGVQVALIDDVLSTFLSGLSIHKDKDPSRHESSANLRQQSLMRELSAKRGWCNCRRLLRSPRQST